MSSEKRVKMVFHFHIFHLICLIIFNLVFLISFNFLLISCENNNPEVNFEAAFQGECNSNTLCQHLCFDLHDGTFECACQAGFILSDNGYSCLENHMYSGEKAQENNSTDFEKKSFIEFTDSNFQENSNNKLDYNNEPIYYSCNKIECEAGGTCVYHENYHDKRVRCQCPLGRGGFFCEKPIEIRFPRFRGKSYLALPTLRDAHKSMEITINFKPEYYEGILLYSGEKQNLEGDFVAIILNQGFVEFRFDCGMGEGVIRSRSPIILNSWNTLTIYRDGWSAWLQLNQEEKVSGSSKGLFSRITFKLELFLGGSPNISIISKRAHTNNGFIGCVRKLEINGHTYDFRSDSRGDAIDAVDTEECNSDVCSTTSCLNGGRCIATSPDKGICLCPLGYAGNHCEIVSKFTVPSFNGSSYLQFTGLKKSILSFVEIQIVFKPRSNNGVLFYNGNKMDGEGDFISINLVNGYVEFRFDLGSGPAVIRSKKKINLNEWHSVLASRTGRMGTLKLDDQSEVKAFASGGFSQLSLLLNLFIGGVLDKKDVSSKSEITHSFSGCIQKVIINGRSLMFVDEALSGINVVDCPHPCTSEPCHQAGQCEPLLDIYTCHCPLGFNGPKCDKEINKIITVPMFYGHSFLHFIDEEILRRIHGSKIDVKIRFRAYSSEGLLFWTGARQSLGYYNFMGIGLKNGLIKCLFNFGSGRKEIIFNITRVNDGDWHNLHIIRYKRELIVKIDKHPTMIEKTLGQKIYLKVNKGLYLGGMEDIEYQTQHEFSKGFIGCISRLILSKKYHVKIVNQANRGLNIKPCV